jgi:hypothetical protein
VKRISAVILAASLAGAASWGTAQQLIIYPAQGQSPQQQSQDQGECQVWATQSTGIDPVALAQQPVTSPTGPAAGGGERVAGAARGALGGLAIGAIAGDSSEGAAIGAVLGTMAGGRRARQNQTAETQQAQAYRQQQVATWNRAVSACLEARGYTVK